MAGDEANENAVKILVKHTAFITRTTTYSQAQDARLSAQLCQPSDSPGAKRPNPVTVSITLFLSVPDSVRMSRKCYARRPGARTK